MNQSPLVALVGNPNAGKTALFNALTGARQKVGNYPGVTVERHAGRMALDDGRPIELVDLPGTYSLDPSSPDEAVTHDVVLGKQDGERLPDALIVVADASNIENHLRFVLQLRQLVLRQALHKLLGPCRHLQACITCWHSKHTPALCYQGLVPRPVIRCLHRRSMLFTINFKHPPQAAGMQDKIDPAVCQVIPAVGGQFPD